MGTFAKGEIVLFPFPFTNLKSRKLRPCLVVSNEMNEDIVLCQITSKNTKKDKYSLEIKSQDCKNGSLIIDFLVRCNMLFTASKHQIVKKLCKINSERYNSVVKKIISIVS